MDHAELEKKKSVNRTFTALFLAATLFNTYAIYESNRVLSFFEDIRDNNKHILLNEFSKECRSSMKQTATDKDIADCAEGRANYSLQQEIDMATTNRMIFGLSGLTCLGLTGFCWRQYKTARDELAKPEMK